MIKIYVIILTFFLTACSNIIRQDKETSVLDRNPESLLLNESTFHQWLASKQQLQLSDKKTQINAYFIEQYLFNNRILLGQPQLAKLKFLNSTAKYAKSVSIIRSLIQNNMIIDQGEVKKQTAIVEQRNAAKADKVRLYQIYKNFPTNASKKIKNTIIQEMKNIKAQTTDLESFKKFAVQYSDSQTRFNNGLIGNVTKGKFTNHLDNIVMQMHKDQVSDVIQGPNGVLLFYCEKRIPKKIKNQQQIHEYVTNTLKNIKIKKDFNLKKKQVLKASGIQINWQFINSSKIDDISVYTNTGNLSNQQIEWLVNGLKTNKELSSFSHEEIKNTIENYMINLSFYNLLEEKQKQDLTIQSDYRFKELVAAQVLAKKIEKQLKPPTLDEEKTHYKNHKQTYTRARHFALSAIAFKLDDKNKAANYQQAYKILEQLNAGNISFEKAAEQYSFLKNKYKEGYLGTFTEKQIPSAIGINALKQIKLMHIGEISPLVETDSGILWIFRLNTIEDPRLMTFSEAKHAIHNQLGNKRVMEIENKIIDKIIKNLQKKVNQPE